MNMNSPLALLLAICLALLFGCKPPSASETAKEQAPVNFSSTYRPSYFAEKERLGRIGDVLTGAHGYYEKCAAANHLPGIAYGVVVDDSLLFFGGSGTINLKSGAPVTRHSLFRIASMSKSFTAMAILKLRDEGRLSLSDPAHKYLPELEHLIYLTADATPVSIFNLLTMTAGFPEDNPWGDRFLDISDDTLLEKVKEGIPFSTLTSLHYEYSNLGYGLLGQIIKRVSGMPYQEYITANILHPLGMTQTIWEYSDAPANLLALGYRWEDQSWKSEALLHDGAFGAMGGLITSMEDFSKYISLHLSAWPPRSDDERGPVKRSTLREMHRMNNPRFYTSAMRFGNTASPLMRAYGYGLVSMLDQEGILEVGHNGGLPGFGSSYMFYPEHGIGIMAFSNLTYVGGAVQTANYRVIEKLREEGLFAPRTIPPSEILLERKEQVSELLLHWDPSLEEEIVATNLYLDISREKRMKEAGQLLKLTGEIVESGPVIPENQLRGTYILYGSRRALKVYFTLSPEPKPKVQWLTLELLPEK